MEADVLSALKSHAAYLCSGARERPLIVVPVPNSEVKTSWKKQPLDISLKYLLNSLSKETLSHGLDVVIDAQQCSWRSTRNIIQYVNDTIHGSNFKIYAVRSEAFWDKQRVENCTRAQKYLDATIVTKTRLLKYFEPNELPEDLGGLLASNYEQWLKNRIRIEDFRKSFNKLANDVEMFKESLSEMKSSRSVEEIEDTMKDCSATHFELQNAIKLITKNGNKLLTELNDSLSRNYCVSRDIVDAKESIRKSLGKLEQRQSDLMSTWSEFERHCDAIKTLRSLSNSVSTVTKWIQSDGERMVGEQTTIGTDLETAETLRDAHDLLEMKCCEIYGLYAEVKYKLKEFTKERSTSVHRSSAYRDLLAQKQFMDFLCRSFANRLERRRLLLTACVRFYRFVTTYFSETSQVFDQLIVGNKINGFDVCIHNLSTLRNKKITLSRIVAALESEGEKLSDLLSMPVKDVFGRDTGLDYSSEIATIREILDEANNRRRIFTESVDLQIITLEQVAYIHTYERDVAIAIKWTMDLFDVTARMHSHVGGDIHEIQRQKQNLQSIQETAQRIFTYGAQLLDASLALRKSCKLSESDNQSKRDSLNEAWNQLNGFCQEQMTRLRVSAVFHRTMEEQCQQLSELKSSVEAECSDDVKDDKFGRLRSYLLNREQLLVDIGRMIRLGRLLKSRLKEPISVEKNNNKIETQSEDKTDGNTIASNAITAKLNEVSRTAESLDIALREMQNCLEINRCRSNSLDRKTEANASFDSRGSTDELNSIAKLSTEDESFHTASECTFTPQSHSSAYETASEGGLMSPWWTSTEKNSFETCSSSDMDSEVPSMQLLSGVISSATTSFDDSEHSFFSTIQSPLTSSDDELNRNSDIEHDIELRKDQPNGDDAKANDENNEVIRIDDENNIFIGDRSSWSLVTKQTVKGCL